MPDDERVLLRPFRESDIPRLSVIANDPRIARNLRDLFPHPYSLEDAERFVLGVALRDPSCFFAVEVSGELAGGAGLHPGEDVYRRQIEIGYWLGVAYWGRGIGTQVVRALLERARARPGVMRVHARVFSWNLASQRVLEKAGFTHEATLRRAVDKGGEIGDEVVYAVLIEQGAAPSGSRPPRSGGGSS